MPRNNSLLIGGSIILGGLLILAGVFDYVAINLPILDAFWPFLLVFAGLACIGNTRHSFIGVGLLLASLFVMAFKYGFDLTDGSRSFLGIGVVLIGLLVLIYMIKPTGTS